MKDERFKSFSMKKFPISIIEELQAIKNRERVNFEKLVPELIKLGLKERKKKMNSE